jgi:hypothetical protein
LQDSPPQPVTAGTKSFPRVSTNGIAQNESALVCAFPAPNFFSLTRQIDGGNWSREQISRLVRIRAAGPSPSEATCEGLLIQKPVLDSCSSFPFDACHSFLHKYGLDPLCVSCTHIHSERVDVAVTMLGKHEEEDMVEGEGPDSKRQRTDDAEEAHASAHDDHQEEFACVQRRPAQPSLLKCLRARDKIHAVERDFSHYFVVDVYGEAGSDQYVFQNFNNLCLVGLAPSHAAISGGKKIIQVDFDVGRTGDKNTIKLSGKKKAGAV